MNDGIIMKVRKLFCARRDYKNLIAKHRALNAAHDQAVKGMAKARVELDKTKSQLEILKMCNKDLHKQEDAI